MLLEICTGQDIISGSAAPNKNKQIQSNNSKIIGVRVVLIWRDTVLNDVNMYACVKFR